MPGKRVLFKRGSFQVTVEKSASQAITKLVSETTWGTPGKTRWKQMRTAFFLPKTINPNWVTLEHDNKPLGTVALLHRRVDFPLGTANSYCVRYLAFPESRQTPPPSVKRSNPKEQKSLLSRSPIRRALAELFEAPEQLNTESSEPEKAVFYAFVEMENERSKEFCKTFGFEPIRNFNTLPFSRMFPQKSPDVSKVTEDEKPLVLNHLKSQYKGFSLFFTDHSFHIGDYYVLKKDGEIIAGVQAIAEHWQICHLPGFSGKLTRKLLPRIPFLSKLFNPDAFHLALFEGIFVRPGHEADLFKLFESVLADMGMNTAFIWMDSDNELYSMIRKSGKLGLLYKISGDSPAQVIARFQGFSAKEIKAFHESPSYLSAFDMA